MQLDPVPSLRALLNQPACALSPALRRALVAAVMLYCLAAALVMDRWQHRGGQPLAALGFGYGVVIHSLDQTGEYRAPAGVHYPGVAFSAHRLPFIPYFLMGWRKVLGDDLGRVALAKCLVFGTLLAGAVGLVLRHSRLPLGAVMAALGLALTMPRWVLNAFEVHLEEGYNIPALALLFALLWFVPAAAWRTWGRAVGIAALVVLLLYLKGSMVYWCLAVPALVWWRDRDLKAALVSLMCLFLGAWGLANFNHANSGRFTIGSSWEGWTLYKGNCAQTAELYPPYSLDILDYEGKVMADRPLKNEWDHSAYFRQKAVDFIRQHPGEFLKLALRKAWIFYAEVRASGLQQRGESRYARPEYLLQIPWMLAFRAALWAAIGLAVLTLWRHPWRSEEGATALTYLVFLGLYSGFHIVGFAYERHVMPIVMPTMLYLLWSWGRSAETVTS